MAQCKGTTKSGNRCKSEAQPDSAFCHMHGEVEEAAPSKAEQAASGAFELEDLLPLIAAGALAAGFFIFMKSIGRWIPRF